MKDARVRAHRESAAVTSFLSESTGVTDESARFLTLLTVTSNAVGPRSRLIRSRWLTRTSSESLFGHLLCCAVCSFSSLQISLKVYNALWVVRNPAIQVARAIVPKPKRAVLGSAVAASSID